MKRTPPHSKMADLELVLRFFALSEYKTMTLTYKDYLSDFVEARNHAYKKDVVLAATDRERFERAVSNCYRVLGEDAFRKPLTNEEARRSGRSARLPMHVAGIQLGGPKKHMNFKGDLRSS